MIWSRRARIGIARSTKKTVSYEALHTIVTFALGWAMLTFAGVPAAPAISYASAFALLDIAVDIVLYYGHERLWAHLE